MPRVIHKFINRSVGFLKLVDGVNHIVGYEVSHVSSHSRAEFEQGLLEYNLSDAQKRLNSGVWISVVDIHPRIEQASLKRLALREGGVVVKDETERQYYLRPESKAVITGLSKSRPR